MYNIVIWNKANNEIIEIHNYISVDNLEIADLVVERIYWTIDYFKIFPYLWKECWKFREFIEIKYKFRIVYEVNEEKNKIIIISIFKNKNNF